MLQGNRMRIFTICSLYIILGFSIVSCDQLSHLNFEKCETSKVTAFDGTLTMIPASGWYLYSPKFDNHQSVYGQFSKLDFNKVINEKIKFICLDSRKEMSIDFGEVNFCKKKVRVIGKINQLSHTCQNSGNIIVSDIYKFRL
jgi:hypothetical protein